MREPLCPRILVLDDDPIMLSLLARMLGAQGVRDVLTCDDGPTALDRVDREGGRLDLILCDLNMPGMDGVEFVRKLGEHRFAGTLIFVSGEDERVLQTTEKLGKAHRIQMLGHLHKPVAPQDLAGLLDRWRQAFKPPSGGVRRTYAAEAIREALGRGEFLNHYQPKVAVRSGEVVGVESLVRWRHPAHGLIYPDQFIGVAEAGGLMDELTDRVLAEALAQARAWQEAGRPLRVAVNVSMDNLARVDFADRVAAMALAAGVAPQTLVLEVTESRLMSDLRAPLDVLTRLRLKRFHLSIDDFGTGHSSLAQLRDIPFDELKIDQGFVHGAASDGTLRAIYDASLGLGRQLGMEVVAEGVEDAADWGLLHATGCPLAQGYLIGRPMPAEALPGWIRGWAERYPQLGPIRPRP